MGLQSDPMLRTLTQIDLNDPYQLYTYLERYLSGSFHLGRALRPEMIGMKDISQSILNMLDKSKPGYPQAHLHESSLPGETSVIIYEYDDPNKDFQLPPVLEGCSILLLKGSIGLSKTCPGLFDEYPKWATDREVFMEACRRVPSPPRPYQPRWVSDSSWMGQLDLKINGHRQIYLDRYYAYWLNKAPEQRPIELLGVTQYQVISYKDFLIIMEQIAKDLGYSYTWPMTFENLPVIFCDYNNNMPPPRLPSELRSYRDRIHLVYGSIPDRYQRLITHSPPRLDETNHSI